MSFWVDCAVAGQMMEFEPDCDGCLVALRKRANEALGISGDPENIREMVGKLLDHIEKQNNELLGLKFFPGAMRTSAYTSGKGLDDQIDADDWYAAELARTKDRSPA